MPKNILVIGATSAIAVAVTRIWAEQGHQMYLLARSAERAAGVAADLRLRGAGAVGAAALDVNDFPRHGAVLQEAAAAMHTLDIVLIAHGTLGDQQACERDFNQALRELNTNAISVISLLTHLAPIFEAQGGGTMAVIASVAGDRGRQSNYVYGAGKAAVAVFLQGLRNRLHPFGVHVLTIKPGFVDTPMTSGFEKGLLWISPDTAAKDIAKAIERRADVAYVPGFWRWIMLMVRCIPESIFKRMRL
jgi:decaprenylphospho-beta-D-erythro-pentofuranosid-2-ulose 2-reductase